MATPLEPGQPSVTHGGPPKRIIVCCDGTWMDSLGENGISRAFCRTCSDGTHQIIHYFPGVGTANALDHFTGGAFGMGLDRDISEVYTFICMNYVDGDDIVLIGFSRGAFTARSVADMIASGLDHFHTIFEDYENMGSSSRHPDEFLIPGLPDYDGSHGQAKIEWAAARMLKYKLGLRERKYARDTYRDGVTEIKIKAVAVWDTVGTLGIPPAPISNKVEYAFQALALDEPRYAFRPSLWERMPGSTTKLKQVWFPGNHGNVGGGWYDQQMSDITLAWMCDQLSTVGVEFNFARLTAIFHESLCFSAAHPFPYAPGRPGSPSSFLPSLPNLSSLKRSLSKLLHSGSSSSKNKRSPRSSTTFSSSATTAGPLPWALPALYTPPRSPPHPSPPARDLADCTLRSQGHCSAPHPPDPSTAGRPALAKQVLLSQGARPWGLGAIRSPPAGLTTLAGTTVRRPGRALRVDETTNEDTAEPLLATNERVHSAVRVRLACRGLGADDNSVWACEALRGSPGDHGDGDGGADDDGGNGSGRWRLERGLALSEQQEEEEVWRVRREGPPELRRNALMGDRPEYPAEAMYPVGEEDHRWRWVWEGPVEGEGQDRVPQVLALPEEPLVGCWERYLLGLLASEKDVWQYAQRGIQG
ncbi:f2c554e2-bbd5-44f9-9491-0f6b106457e8 [Thermothielavioides terrestris]|uniref:F2c554e2-bbd5-44f9-9491-0f6b106457e8 n=1 Tax=Thermothielavioides terrestris TaxID=2587410 RepID=A0A3S4AYF8_9PEZI|nr:f2c554e2-bbd5-44f9-9491-0f6b106457e8 [Thermothielavioides terrestris]